MLKVGPVPIPVTNLNRNRLSLNLSDTFQLLDAAEATLEAELKRAERLRQSILKHAFSGKLVPQDPDDEPASLAIRENPRRESRINNRNRKRGQQKRKYLLQQISCPCHLTEICL